ncbi:MAG: T9SS type A sorting domain-containing protein [Bacteroidia bacterium]
MLLYPNPASDRLTLSGDFAAKATIRLFSLSGKLVLSPKVVQPGSPEVELNVSSLSAGMYFLQVMSESGRVWSEKVLVE